ncbi:ATP-binding protein [uncultured Mobiluncus sp.]|uniref:ATP-binding protein n=1 Tax=uncultured Mobiluncus sp. TaxID=293425 RepID=UPI00345C4C47
MKTLEKYPLLIIDEFGYLPIDADAANLFFQLISDRYEQGSLIITSNLPFSQWGEIPGSTTIATAIIDRVVHHAQVLQTSGESYRLRNHDQPNPVK